MKEVSALLGEKIDRLEASAVSKYAEEVKRLSDDIEVIEHENYAETKNWRDVMIVIEKLEKEMLQLREMERSLAMKHMKKVRDEICAILEKTTPLLVIAVSTCIIFKLVTY